MILESVRIKNFRTIISDTVITFSGGATIVGPNSSGKTNLLKAVEMFFTGFDNKYKYLHHRDFPEGLEAGQTSLTATVVFEEDDELAKAIYREINSCLDQPKTILDKATVYLTFSSAGRPSYRMFVGEKYDSGKKLAFIKNQNLFLELLFGCFNCHYVAASKNIDTLYGDLLLPYLRKYIACQMQDVVGKVKSGLDEVSKVIDSKLSLAGMSNIKSHFRIPNDSIESLLSGFEFHLADPIVTEIGRKGMGIQSASMIASFIWISQEEGKLGKTPIWLIEEPESYLHPELASSCYCLLRELAEIAHVVVTTHSLAFVPKDPKLVMRTEIEDGATTTNTCGSYIEATRAIRNALGVKFSDFCNLGLFNVFVEGKSDREIFKWVLSRVPVKATGKHAWENVRNAEFLDFGGVGALEGFVKASWEYVHKERPVVCILDGDEAGDKTRRNIQGFLGKKKLPFEPNKNFIVLPVGFALEGLFPHEWILEAKEEHPNWFEKFGHDLNGKLLPFECKDDNAKERLREYLKRKAEGAGDESWIGSFERLFTVIDESLEAQSKKMYSRSESFAVDVETV